MQDKQRKWFDYVLLGAFALAATVMVLLMLGAFVVPLAINRAIETYTDEQPQVVPEAELDEAKYEQLQLQIETFVDAFDTESPPDPLALSGEDLNALLQKELDGALNPGDGQPSRGRFRLRLQGDVLQAKMSVLMDELATGYFEGLTGRYLNGMATFKPSLNSGALDLRLQSFEVHGKALPRVALSPIQDFIDTEIRDSDEIVDFVNKLDSIEICEGALILRAK